MQILTVLVVAAGVLVGVGLLVRPSQPRNGLEANPMVARVSGDVHAGEEQVLIHLARSLQVATGRAEVAYGEIYIAGSTGTLLRLASRSEIGRGFDGEIRVRRNRRSTVAEYFILRLPGDEALHARIAGLDDEIVRALRALDPAAQIRTVPEVAAPQRRFLANRV